PPHNIATAIFGRPSTGETDMSSYPHPIPTKDLPRRLRWLAAIEAALGWVLAYPLLLLQIVLLLFIAWGWLGKALGLQTLFWHEDANTQLLNGLASGWLFGEILLVRYLLDPGRNRFVLPLSLFPCQEATVRRLGEFLLVAWPASLLLLAGVKAIMPSSW